MKTSERIAGRLVESDFTVHQVVVLLSTIYNYTLSFAMEEQAIFPRTNERSPQYDIVERNAQAEFGGISDSAAGRSDSFDRFDHRYKEGLDLIVRGAMSVR